MLNARLRAPSTSIVKPSPSVRRAEKSSTCTARPEVGSGRTGHGCVRPPHTSAPRRSRTLNGAGSRASDTHTARFGPAGR